MFTISVESMYYYNCNNIMFIVSLSVACSKDCPIFYMRKVQKDLTEQEKTVSRFTALDW